MSLRTRSTEEPAASSSSVWIPTLIRRLLALRARTSLNILSELIESASPDNCCQKHERSPCAFVDIDTRARRCGPVWEKPDRRRQFQSKWAWFRLGRGERLKPRALDPPPAITGPGDRPLPRQIFTRGRTCCTSGSVQRARLCRSGGAWILRALLKCI